MDETKPPLLQPHRWHWLISEQATDRIICEWLPAEQCWLPSGEGIKLSPRDMWLRGWRWSAAVGGQPEPLRVCVFQDWLFELSMQQQSVLVLACRGPDGVGKDHKCKPLISRYRAVVLKSARLGRALRPGESATADSFMTLERDTTDYWAWMVTQFFDSVDGIPHHYYTHLMHGAQIAGYKHPSEYTRALWSGFYFSCCNNLHLAAETEEEMDRRLCDWGRKHWG